MMRSSPAYWREKKCREVPKGCRDAAREVVESEPQVAKKPHAAHLTGDGSMEEVAHQIEVGQPA